MSLDQPDRRNRRFELEHSLVRCCVDDPTGGPPLALDVMVAIEPWSRAVVESCLMDPSDWRLVLTALRAHCAKDESCDDDALIAWGARSLGCSVRLLRGGLNQEIRCTSAHKDEEDLA